MTAICTTNLAASRICAESLSQSDLDHEESMAVQAGLVWPITLPIITMQMIAETANPGLNACGAASAAVPANP